MIQGERQFDLVVRMQAQFRSDENAIRNLLIATPDGQHLPLEPVRRHPRGKRRVVHLSRVEFALSSACSSAWKAATWRARWAKRGRRSRTAVKLPIGYRFDWGGEYKDYLASQEQMKIILPLTVLLILLILFALYGNLKFPADHLLQRAGDGAGGRPAGAAADAHQLQRVVDARIRSADGRGGADQRHSLFVHQQAAAGRQAIMEATLEASLLRLRPIMMTALVACFGLLPAAMSTGIGSDSQRPFAIVIVGGLASRLLLSIFLSPVLYALVARDGDTLQV